MQLLYANGFKNDIDDLEMKGIYQTSGVQTYGILIKIIQALIELLLIRFLDFLFFVLLFSFINQNYGLMYGFIIKVGTDKISSVIFNTLLLLV